MYQRIISFPPLLLPLSLQQFTIYKYFFLITKEMYTLHGFHTPLKTASNLAAAAMGLIRACLFQAHNMSLPFPRSGSKASAKWCENMPRFLSHDPRGFLYEKNNQWAGSWESRRPGHGRLVELGCPPSPGESLGPPSSTG